MVLNPSQFPKLTVPYDKVLARLGYARGRTALDRKTEEIIKEEIELSAKLLGPKQVIASSKVVLNPPSSVKLEPGLTIRSVKISELLKNCSIAYGFAVTIGPHIEEKMQYFIEKKEAARALIIDAIGSVMAEELAEISNAQIRDEAAGLGLLTTMRFSPGYGDWSVMGQKNFLKWLGADKIGIKLTEQFQMLPEKSVSAIMGLYK
jgi:hypothetical protein